MAETQRANPLNTPMTASYNDPVVAVDELGREIRMTRTGQRYLATDLAPTRPQATAGRGLGYNILDNIIGYDDGVDTPGERAGAAIGAIASDPIGAARGAATGIGGLIERLVGGTGTMGDVVDATGLLNLGSAVGAAPRGALRAGASRNIEDYGGSHRAPGREYGASLDDPREMFGGDDIYSENAMRYFGHGDTAMDRESIRAINAARGNPDAEITVYRAIPSDLEGAEINMGDWVTPSRRYAEIHGEGPLGGDYQIIEQKVRAGDLFTDGDIHEWGYTPEPQTSAQRVAGLLASGRADEVTDEMMAAADPQEMARLYASGATGMDLPMDEASRMARAREMGFNPETRFHGTKANITDQMRLGQGGTMGEGVYTASDPIYSDFFAGVERVGDETRFREGGNVLPLLTRGETMPFEQFAQMRFDARRANASGEFGENFDLGDYLDNEMRRQGFTGVRSDEYGPVRGRDEVATRYPSDIRSRFARFDPRLSHLSNLNAANASPLLGGAVLAAPQEQPDPLRNLRGLLAR